MNRLLTLTLLLIATLPALAQSGDWRNWTSADGRPLEAQLVSVTEDSVTVKRRTDLRTITIQFDQLSEADQTFALAEFKKQQMGSANAAAEEIRTKGLKDGKYSDLIKDEFVRTKTEDGMPYQFWGSKDFDGEERYPLVLFLHGGGSRGGDEDWPVGMGADIWTKDEHRDKQPCFVLAPRCPEPTGSWRGEYGDKAAALVKDLADNLPIDRSRIYVTGSSLGGSGSWYAITAHQDLFAATILSASGGSPGDVDKIKDFPIWQFHGELDADSPVEAARKMAEAMKAAGAPNYTYSELLQQPHSISGEIYPNAEFREWLFSWKKTEDGSVRE